MPYSDEIENGIFRVGPAIIVNIGVESFTHEACFARFQVVNTQTVAVAFIAVASHREPSHILAVRRKLRIGVVAREILQILLAVDRLGCHRLGSIALRFHIAFRLAEVLGLASTYIIKENVGVGRDGILNAFFLAASIGNGLGVGAPVELLNTSKGCHRTFVGLACKDVFTLVDGSDSCNIS